MSHGLEQFETGWKNNQLYITSLSDDVLDSSGFNQVAIGVLNTATNAYAAGVSFTSPNFGKKITAVVTSTLGVSLTPITITVTYQNQVSTPHTGICTFPQGASVNTAETVYLLPGDSVSGITIASASPTTSGTIQFLVPTSLVETFDNTTWGPPDPGL